MSKEETINDAMTYLGIDKFEISKKQILEKVFEMGRTDVLPKKEAYGLDKVKLSHYESNNGHTLKMEFDHVYDFVEYSLKAKHPQIVVQNSMYAESANVMVGYEPWTQFPPYEYKELISKVYNRIVDAWTTYGRTIKIRMFVRSLIDNLPDNIDKDQLYKKVDELIPKSESIEDTEE